MAPTVVTCGAAITLIGTFLTWVRSGTAERTSYQVFGVVERLGFSPNGIVGLALRAWPLVPLLLVLATVATWYGVDHVLSHVATAALTCAAAVYPGAVAVAVLNAPDIALFGTGTGPAVTIVGAAVVLAGAAINAIRLARSTGPSAPADDRS